MNRPDSLDFAFALRDARAPMADSQYQFRKVCEAIADLLELDEEVRKAFLAVCKA